MHTFPATLSLILSFAVLAGCSRRPSRPRAIIDPYAAQTESTPSESTPQEAAPARGAAAVAAARSWALYYGPATPDIVDRLGGFDLVVIDPSALGDKAAETIAALKKRGCAVAGYLSYFEVAKWHRYLNRVNPEWFVKLDGKDWIPWGSNPAASLSVPEWRALLVELTKSEVLDYGCDGVFMDTIADLDSPSLPEELRTRELDGLGALMAALDEAYPDAFFITNWTIQRTLPVVAPHAAAVCWEDFVPAHFEKDDTRAWMEGIAKGIAAVQAKHPFRVLTLWNENSPGEDIAARQARMREISAEHGFLPFCTVGGYHSLPVAAP